MGELWKLDGRRKRPEKWVELGEGQFSTALSAAAAGGQQTIDRRLVNKEASLSPTDAAGRTALYLASWNCHIRIFQSLLEAGADKSTSNKEG